MFYATGGGEFINIFYFGRINKKSFFKGGGWG
jgi:hypothetical protein